MKIRKARFEEFDEIYKMGFDAWGEGQGLDIYLEGCRESPKYGKGSWFVLVDEEGRIRSSLIRYVFSEGTCGIGSIATPKELRKKGYASLLVTLSLNLFEGEGFSRVFLFSDIDPKFYERLGFAALPPKHQRYPGSVCMVRGISIDSIERGVEFRPPDYF